MLFTILKSQKHPQCLICPFISVIDLFYKGIGVDSRLWGHTQVIRHNLDVALKVQRGREGKRTVSSR